MFNDNKGVGLIISRKSKKGRQYNGQKKTDKRPNNDLQSITQKTKDRVTRTQLKTEVELVVAIDLNSPLYFNMLSK
jgi:hypothetical protein